MDEEREEFLIEAITMLAIQQQENNTMIDAMVEQLEEQRNINESILAIFNNLKENLEGVDGG